MKKIFILFFIVTSIMFSQSEHEKIATDIVPGILKANSAHQDRLLEIIGFVQNYNELLSDKYIKSVEKVTHGNVPYEICEEIVSYGGDMQIMGTVDMNLSYILDLTQSYFSIYELADIIRNDNNSQKKYLSRLLEQSNNLNEELRDKYDWVLSVEEYYVDSASDKVKNIVSDIKILFKEMLEYYSVVNANLLSMQKI